MKLKSHAKLNLTLDIHAKLKNGLHDIQSNVSLLNLHDEIYVNKSRFKDKIKFYGKFSGLVRSKNNSIFNALKILLMPSNPTVREWDDPLPRDVRFIFVLL